MDVQVTDAHKNLASLSKMVEEGNDILLSKARGCWISNERTGFKLPMRLEKGCTPEFDVWVKKADSMGKFGVLNVDGEADICEVPPPPFQRLEKAI